jgi:putative hydroxymethylpyrimidine transport system substrate-binding protein
MGHRILVVRKIFLIVALVAAAAFWAGCGGGDDAETAEARPGLFRKIAVTLDGGFNAENVGLLMAVKRGYFAEVDLGVELREPVLPERPINYVVGRDVDLAISHQPQVVLQREKGAPIAAVGSLVSRPTAAMIWLKKSKIGGVVDLKGRTIAIYGLPFERGLLKSVLTEAGLTLADVKVKNVNYETVPDLVSGRADAIFGSWNVEGAELKARGLKPVIAPVQDFGLPAYDELVVIARRDRLSSSPWLVRDFMSAVERGTAAAIEDPEAAVNAIAEEAEDPDRKAIEASVEATLPLLSRSGHMSSDQASRLIDWMNEVGLTQRRIPVPALLTNRYLESE